MMRTLPLFIIILLPLIFITCGDSSHKQRSENNSELVKPDQHITTETKGKEENTSSQSKMNPWDPDFLIGRWEAEEKNGFSFELWLNVNQDSIYGQYCAINEDATRIDCGEVYDDCLVFAPYPVETEYLDIEITSCYSFKKGMARLIITEEGLAWRILEPPGNYGRDYFAPSEAKLIKTHFDPFEIEMN